MTNEIIVAFCPLCEGAGLVSPAREVDTKDPVFVCDECLAVYESLEDLAEGKFRELRAQHELLTKEEAEFAGLGKYLMYFDTGINRWRPLHES